ncbi:hypothetical protein DDI_2008 [Dickeya dianthicola RNS04.9]|nr:hypothetical protein DDI_2008 [Dickeya dianthicola RNS04.9]
MEYQKIDVIHIALIDGNIQARKAHRDFLLRNNYDFEV